MRTFDEIQAGIHNLVKQAGEAVHHSGDAIFRQLNHDIVFDQLASDIDTLLADLRSPWKLLIAGGVTASALRLNFAFKELTYTFAPEAGSTADPQTAAVVAYLGSCSLLAEAFLSIDAPGAKAVGMRLDVDEYDVPTQLAAILVRVDLEDGRPPRVVELGLDGWGGTESEAAPSAPHVELGDIPYRNLTLHLQGGEINALTYDLAGEWQPEQFELVRATIRRHLRLIGAGPAGQPS